MLEPGGELDFALEPLGVDARRPFRREHLDDDLTPQADLSPRKT